MAFLRQVSWLLVSLSVLVLSAEALAPAGRTSTKVHQQIQSEVEAPSSNTVSRRNLFQQTGIASASIFLSSLGFSNPLPAQAAETLDDYLVSAVSSRNPRMEDGKHDGINAESFSNKAVSECPYSKPAKHCSTKLSA